MNLKKSDKIVAIVGVAILVIAAIFIIAYNYEPDEVDDETPKEKIYKVTWKEDFGSEEIVVENFGKEIYTKSYPISKSIDGAVITSVDVQIEWEDTSVYGGLFGMLPALVKGQDKLTATFSVDGKAWEYEKTWGGNETESFYINDKPSDEIIEEVEDKKEAEKKILSDYSDMNSFNLDVEAQVTTGEKLRHLRILKFLGDKGEGFNLHVTYTYYYPVIMEEENGEPPEDGNVEGSYNTTPYASTLNSMSFH